MDPERWHRLTEIFHAAAEREPSARAEYLAAACADDASLRVQVEAMLAGDDAVSAGPDPLVRGPRVRPGDALGPYRIEALLGSGGMGEVYKARDTRLNRTVAIKVLPAALQHEQALGRRFAREAQAIASLSHPNICVLHDVGTDDGVDFLVMEYLEGETLQRRLESGALPIGQALDVAMQVGAALARAHRAGIVHRDLKPANVMLTRTGAKVLDFGLVKFTVPAAGGAAALPGTPTTLTGAGVMMGTLHYMAPEQVEGRDADARTDVFALGSLLYEMITGRRPFAGDSPSSLIASILRDEPPPMSSRAGGSPPALDSVVRACLAKDADDRVQAAQDVVLQLRWIRDHGVPARPAGTGLRRKAIAAAALALTATAAATAGGYWLGRARAPAATHPTYRQMTFRRGPIGSARFSPDGQTIVFSAAWDGMPQQVFSMRIDTAEPQSQGLPSGTVLSISRSGMLAMVHGKARTLGEVPLGGSGVHDRLDDVAAADWSPDGTELAVLRDVGGQRSIEYPIGKTVYTTSANLNNLRVSRDGSQLAVMEDDTSGGGWIDVVDRSGHLTRLTRRWPSLCGCFAWSPSGAEIWFSASDVGLNLGVHAVGRNGRERALASSMASAYVLDVAPDGRVLLNHEVRRGGIAGVIAGEARDLSWLDFSRPAELSADGGTLVFTESGAAAGPTPVVYVRRTDGSDAIPLIGGEPVGLSSDGQWVAARSPDGHTLTLVPTASGRPKPVAIGPLTVFRYGAWLPDGTGLVLNASADGQPRRAFVQPLDGGHARPITPEGVGLEAPVVVSPDSRFVLAKDKGTVTSYPINGGAATQIVGVRPGETVLRWSPDRVLWVRSGTNDRPQIVRLDLATGQRPIWKEIAFPDRAGLLPGWFRPMISADGNTYVYGYVRALADLYLAEHLQ